MKYLGIIVLAVALCATGVVLVAQEKAPQAATTKAAVQYTCPMHPDVKADAPGSCPKCGMKLEKAAEKMVATKKAGKGCCGNCCANMKEGKGMKSQMDCPVDSVKSVKD